MLDIKFIRENPDLIRAAVKKKQLEFDLDRLLALDVQRLKILTEVEQMRATQNQASQQGRPTEGPAAAGALIEAMGELKNKLQAAEKELSNLMRDWRQLMLEVPNVPDASVPDGAGEENNQEVRRWGQVPQFNFTPKSHIELLAAGGSVDLERGTRAAGFRGYFLRDDAVRFSFALWQLALDKMVEKGFTPMMVPSLVRPELLLGTGYLPQGAADLYKTQDDLYLAGTGEVGAMGYFMDEVFDRQQLPKKVVAFSPCFRREAGSHGQDTKGLIRVHEFFKVEQLVLCAANHEESVRWHEALTVNAEELLQALGLAYRVVVLGGGDLGRPSVKTYDIEVWLPSENRYRETHSSSYYHDFQSRRLNIRYRDGERLSFVHSLNNTALATPRLLAALVENYQQPDGGVAAPAVLQPYWGKAKFFSA